MKPRENYYITTAIAYTSAKPHIGNIYEIVLTDAIARFKREQGYNVYFQTGTDEHGQKIEEYANNENRAPQAHVDEIAGVIKDLFDLMNISYDSFIRTTDPFHKHKVQQIFDKLYKQGDLYKDFYEGWYCKSCESFYSDSQIGEAGKCPECHGSITREREESYFFNLKKYQEKLLKHIEENPNFIVPESRKNEMVRNFLQEPLYDLAVSRTSFKWGIPVDFDPEHVVYVWIDALTNYITGIGYDVDGHHESKFNDFWPADVHVIGKDILRFHTIYWPILLMALDIELPKQIFGHPWLLIGDGKMSKSKGNVIYADDLVKVFGVDAVRYLMLHEIPYDRDGTLSFDSMVERVNTDLANILGNLVNRTISMVNKYFNGVIEVNHVVSDVDGDLYELRKDLVSNVEAYMNEYKVSKALDCVINLLRRSNKYIDETEPWNLAKNDADLDRLQTVLYNLLDSIRISAIVLRSFIPETSDKILDQLNIENRSLSDARVVNQYPLNHKVIDKPQIIFSRLDVKETIEKLEEVTSSKELKQKDDKYMQEEITFEEFSKMDIRVVEVVEVEKHPDADRLYVIQVNDGNQTIQVVSGLVEHYEETELIGKKVLLLKNLKPAKLRGIMSHGMILAAKDQNQLEVLTASKVELGSKIS